MTDVINNFIEKKNAQSPFLSLKNKESVKVLKVKAIKSLTKSGYSGEDVEVLRLSCDVETSEGVIAKNFDNSSKKFAEELVKENIVLGSSFTLTREGEGPKTVYKISNVVNPK